MHHSLHDGKVSAELAFSSIIIYCMGNYIASYSKRQQCLGENRSYVGLRIEKHKCYFKSALIFFSVD